MNTHSPIPNTLFFRRHLKTYYFQSAFTALLLLAARIRRPDSLLILYKSVTYVRTFFLKRTRHANKAAIEKALHAIA